MENLEIIIVVLLSVAVLLLMLLILRGESQYKNIELKLLERFSNMQNINHANGAALLSAVEVKIQLLEDKIQNTLEDVRLVLDRELRRNLSARLNESFDVVAKSLERVQNGLGEMNAMAKDTRELRDILTNVKNRGNFGEVLLGKLLSDMLAPNQYVENVEIKKGKRVEFAVKLPGNAGETVLLPIDSKFPIESYNRIINAGGRDETEAARKELYRAVREFAKSIALYIEIPMTTNFALMFLPTEGLYAEVVRNAELVEEVRNKYSVMIVGATTLSGLIASILVGFKTLAIEKRSEEVWKVLSGVKREFIHFGAALEKAKTQIGQAESTIDVLLSTRMRQMNKALREVDQEVDTAGTRDESLSDSECEAGM